MDGHEPPPRTPQSLLNSDDRRQENVDLASFDLLHSADVEIDHFGELLLRHRFGAPLSAHVRPEVL